MTPQSAILDPVPAHARHLFFELKPATDPRAALRALAAACDGNSAVLGIGAGVAAALGMHLPGTAQEDFEPEAFVVRRSMPWVAGADAGLVFLAFGKSFDAYEAQLRRMTGHDDGISDALFSLTRPLTGGYYWCPPLGAAGVDLQALGL